MTVSLPPVTTSDLAGLRQRVTEAALRVGLSSHRAATFTVAVNEIVINAVEHGGGAAHVTLELRAGCLVVEVHDDGVVHRRITAPTVTPPTDQPHGRGLWLARQLSDELVIDTGAAGTKVRLSAAA